MTKWTALAGPATLLFVFAGPAQADLTAMQVWEKWRSQMLGMGLTVEGASDVQGDTLRITDLAATSDNAEAGSRVVMGVDEVAFRELGDGTVEITMSEVMTIYMQITPPEAGDEAVMAMTVAQTGYNVIASGDETEIVYDFTATEMVVGLDSITVDGEAQEFDMGVLLGDISGSYVIGGEDLVSASGSFDAAALEVAFAGVAPADPEEDDNGKSDATSAMGERFDMLIALTEIESTFDGTFALIGSDNMAEMLAAGFEISSDLTHGPGSYAIEVEEDGAVTMIQLDLGSGGTSSQLNASRMGYTVIANGLEVAVASPDIPFPQLSLAADAVEIGFDMPVAASDTPDDFATDVVIEGLAIDDMIWGMLDPQAMLPHSPATLILALSGQANWFYDLMDPEAAEALVDDDRPGELHTLSLDALQIAVAGAELTGGGDFTFDNDDLETFEGLPKPTGALDLQLTGGMGLLDTLVEMGLVPTDQAMGARMMLGAFARPGEGEDSLVSRIEVTEDGGILANGQRIK